MIKTLNDYMSSHNLFAAPFSLLVEGHGLYTWELHHEAKRHTEIVEFYGYQVASTPSLKQ